MGSLLKNRLQNRRKKYDTSHHGLIANSCNWSCNGPCLPSSRTLSSITWDSYTLGVLRSPDCKTARKNKSNQRSYTCRSYTCKSAPDRVGSVSPIRSVPKCLHFLINKNV